MGSNFSKKSAPVFKTAVKSTAVRKYFTGTLSGKLRPVGNRSFPEETTSRRRLLTGLQQGPSAGEKPVPEVKQVLQDYLQGPSAGEKSVPQSSTSRCTAEEPELVQWNKPKKGFVKVNVNASVKNSKGAVGGVIRDWEGHFKLAFRKVLQGVTSSCAYAEFLAALCGMEVVVEEGHKNVCLESDNEGLVQKIKSWMGKSTEEIELTIARGCGPDRQARHECLAKIIQLIRRCDCVEVSHTYKEGNRLAGHFARMDTMTEGRVIIRELDDDEAEKLWDHDFKGLQLPKGYLNKQVKNMIQKTKTENAKKTKTENAKISTLDTH